MICFSNWLEQGQLPYIAQKPKCIGLALERKFFVASLNKTLDRFLRSADPQ